MTEAAAVTAPSPAIQAAPPATPVALPRADSTVAQQDQIEGTYQCRAGGRVFHYLASYTPGRSVDWHATVRCGASFSWSTGTIAHNVRNGEELAQHVRAHVLSAIGVMAWI